MKTIYPVFHFDSLCLITPDRETRKGWPLLTVETETNGDSKSTNERSPSLIGSLGSSCQYERFFFCSVLAALVAQYKIYFYPTVHYFNSFVLIAQQAGPAVVQGRLSLDACLWLTPLCHMSQNSGCRKIVALLSPIVPQVFPAIYMYHCPGHEKSFFCYPVPLPPPPPILQIADITVLSIPWAIESFMNFGNVNASGDGGVMGAVSFRRVRREGNRFLEFSTGTKYGIYNKYLSAPILQIEQYCIQVSLE